MHGGRPAALLDRLHDDLGRLLQGDVHALTDAEVLEATCDVYRLEARVAALKVRLVGELDARQAYAPVGAQNATQWIKARCHTPGGSARADVLLARSLRHLPVTEAKLADGDIGAAQATRIAQQHRNPRTQSFAEHDEELLATHAAELTWKSFATAVAYWAERADPDGVDLDAEARRARRRVHLSRSFEGEWILDGVLDPVDGAVVDSALQRVESELFNLDRAETRDQALLRTPAQRRADALVELAQRAMGAPAGARKPAPLITILVGYETFAGRVCELADGTVLAPSDVAALLDTAVIERAVFDSPARVTEISEQRCFTGALRRAIQIRDRTCTHPYCDRPAERCDVDHIQPAAANGPTVQTNGRAACPFHNHLRQRRGPPGGDW